MSVVTNLPAFLVAVVAVSMTPGPAFALIVRRTALRGLSHGIATVVGLEFGLYLWALLVASGFAVIATAQLGYLIVKTVGCAVLLWLAVRSLRAWWAERRCPTYFDPASRFDVEPDRGSGLGSQHDAAGARLGRWWAVGEGFVVQMANPKAAVFLLALYPQFVPHDQPLFASTAVLGLVQVGLELILYSALAFGVSLAATWFRSSLVRRRLEAVNGTVLLGLGIRLAVSEGPARTA